MNRIVYNNFKSYLIKIIRKKTPLFGEDIDDESINVGLYWFFYTLAKKKDKMDDMCTFYFDKSIDEIETDFKSSPAGKGVTITNIFERYMTLSSMAYENRKLYFYMIKHTCYVDDDGIDCVKLVPVEIYKEKKDLGISHEDILRDLKLDDGEKYLFIDRTKLKSLYSIDFATLPPVVRVNCNTEKYFKKLCSDDLLYKGSSRPTTKRLFTSYRCKCWPMKVVDEYMNLHATGQYGGSKNSRDTEEFLEKIFGIE